MCWKNVKDDLSSLTFIGVYSCEVLWEKNNNKQSEEYFWTFQTEQLSIHWQDDESVCLFHGSKA